MRITTQKLAKIAQATVCMAIPVLVLFSGRALPAGAEPSPLPYVIEDESRLPPGAARLYTYVSKPFFPGELAYRQIPWVVDLNEGLRMAREEKRPLLLWTSGDDPLDRC